MQGSARRVGVPTVAREVRIAGTIALCALATMLAPSDARAQDAWPSWLAPIPWGTDPATMEATLGAPLVPVSKNVDSVRMVMAPVYGGMFNAYLTFCSKGLTQIAINTREPLAFKRAWVPLQRDLHTRFGEPEGTTWKVRGSPSFTIALTGMDGSEPYLYLMLKTKCLDIGTVAAPVEDVRKEPLRNATHTASPDALPPPKPADSASPPPPPPSPSKPVESAPAESSPPEPVVPSGGTMIPGGTPVPPPPASTPDSASSAAPSK